ncbi:MAG: DUF2726 domain-containing protein [Massilia sp.]
MLRRLLHKHTDAIPAFQRTPLFLDEERRFYARLRRALPKTYIFPNIDLATLMVPVSATPRENRAAVNYLAGRRVDFAVFDAKLNLLCVIELEHEGADPAESNEEVLKRVGIKRYSWKRDQLPSGDQILRALAGFSLLDAPRLEPVGVTVGEGMARAGAPDEPCLSPAALEKLGAGGHILGAYPHVWKRICALRCEPLHMDQYLSSLSIQDRPVKRSGFSAGAMAEIAAIQKANARFIAVRAEPQGWDNALLTR